MNTYGFTKKIALVGTGFVGMSFAFDKIVVDARYVLFIIDKYAGAKNLIDELKIIE